MIKGFIITITIIYSISVIILIAMMFGKSGIDFSKKVTYKSLLGCFLWPLLWIKPFLKWLQKGANLNTP